jgi:hypothetical protein
LPHAQPDADFLHRRTCCQKEDFILNSFKVFFYPDYRQQEEFFLLQQIVLFRTRLFLRLFVSGSAQPCIHGKTDLV